MFDFLIFDLTGIPSVILSEAKRNVFVMSSAVETSGFDTVNAIRRPDPSTSPIKGSARDDNGNPASKIENPSHSANVEILHFVLP